MIMPVANLSGSVPNEAEPTNCKEVQRLAPLWYGIRLTAQRLYGVRQVDR